MVEQRKMQDMLQRFSALILDNTSNSDVLPFNNELSQTDFGFGSVIAELKLIAEDDSYA